MEAIVGTEYFLAILAALVAAGVLLALKCVWLCHSAGAPTEGLLPVAGPFGEKEIEVLGPPPRFDQFEGEDTSVAKQGFSGKGLPGGERTESSSGNAANSDRKGSVVAAGVGGVSDGTRPSFLLLLYDSSVVSLPAIAATSPPAQLPHREPECSGSLAGRRLSGTCPAAAILWDAECPGTRIAPPGPEPPG